jgi:L-lactate dehydrogenase complex protein LldG
MLDGIRSSLAKSAAFEDLYHHLQPSPRKSDRHASALSPTELAERFSTELTSVGGEVHRAANEERAVEAIREVLANIGATNAAISDLELLKSIDGPDIELIENPSREQLFAVDAGITAAQLAIAETGTLVLRSASERHRLVSLVPPVHICLLRTNDIRPTMHDVLEEMSNAIDPTITFITGPSRTSDIELTLAIGVHGPKRLIVVLID